MASLTDEQKSFLVSRFAAFRTPQQAADDVKAEFGIEISREQARNYDPRVRHKRSLPKRWIDLFKAERDAYVKETSGIAYAHRSHRLRTLERLIDIELAKARPNVPLVASLMEQAAKEAGDAFTNRVNLNHSGKVRHEHAPDERTARLAQLFGKLMGTSAPATVKAE